jgi:predicted MPP superfamily phosphohydrolase
MDTAGKASTVFRYAIGDVHGRPFWKSYIKDSYKEFYFTGDYFDSFDIPFSKQYDNFVEICKEARKNKRIKMCLGNHDYHYLRGVYNQTYSGYQYHNREKIADILEKNIDLLKVLYVTADKYIISHAGVTRTFLKSTGGTQPEDINSIFSINRNALRFNGINIYGDDVTQSPIWVRTRSLERDRVPGYSQIVGHTPQRSISEQTTKDGCKLVYIDTHDTESIYKF